MIGHKGEIDMISVHIFLKEFISILK